MDLKLKPFNFVEWLQKGKCACYTNELSNSGHDLGAREVKNLIFYNELLSMENYSIDNPIFCGIRDYDNDPGICLWDIRGQYTDDLGENLMMEYK